MDATHNPDPRVPSNPDALRPSRRNMRCPTNARVQSWETWCRDAGVTPWASGTFPERHRTIAWVPHWRAHSLLTPRHGDPRTAVICIGARGVPPVTSPRERALRVLEILAFGQNDYATRETVCRLDLWGPPDDTSRGPWAVEHARCMGARERRRRARRQGWPAKPPRLARHDDTSRNGVAPPAVGTGKA